MNEVNYEEVEKRIGIVFENKELLQIALTHRSFLNENKDYHLSHNERLEFLGDAVLEVLVTEELYRKYPGKPEGILTSVRSATVRTETLADRSRNLDYGKHLLMSHGEESTGGRDRDYILANTFEAMLGAIYLDKGMETCKVFLQKELFPIIPSIINENLYIDNKSKLQELAQDVLKSTPFYELKSEEGPDHDKVFTMAVKIGEKEYGTGKGKNKQAAEQEAAGQAYKKISNQLN
jgi:ribonuclease-3